ncbi:MAG TPA: phosphoribosylanthranilate isomerase, partial [Gemmataceae bacterium]|nr:phosphoribosylanthranilate isomerase [Gemmataceae bacterium]
MAPRVRVKICGVTNEADARQAALLGADAVGLNFCAGSPRRIDEGTAAYILRELPPFVEAVGVFAGQPLREVWPVLNRLGRVRTAQVHGGPRELCDAFPFQLICAFQVRDASGLTEVTRYLDVARRMGRLPAAVLVDGYAPGQHGGTGRAAPWDLLADLHLDVPLILAGGLTPENVAEAVRRVRPYAVDVASGVERAPGHKDP